MFIKSQDTTHLSRGTVPKRKVTIIVALAALIMIGVSLTLLTFATLSISTTLTSTGSVSSTANLGLYSDSGCTTPLNSINWGTITAGGNVTETIYIKNISSGLALTLNIATSNWSPSNSNEYLTISWNQNGTRLQPCTSTSATLTLIVSPAEVGITTFNAQILITGTN